MFTSVVSHFVFLAQGYDDTGGASRFAIIIGILSIPCLFIIGEVWHKLKKLDKCEERILKLQARVAELDERNTKQNSLTPQQQKSAPNVLEYEKIKENLLRQGKSEENAKKEAAAIWWSRHPDVKSSQIDRENAMEYLMKCQESEVKDWLADAEKGDAQAQCELGYAYQHGNGVPQNMSEAAKWFRKSAEQGCAEAQVSLGVMYHLGMKFDMGVVGDIDEARRWYQKAAAQGDKSGIEQLAILNKRVSS